MDQRKEFFLAQDDWLSLCEKVRSKSNRVLDRSTHRRGLPQVGSIVKDYDGMIFPRSRISIMTLLILTSFTDYFQPFSEYLRIEIYNYLRKTLREPVLAAAALLSAKGCLFLIMICYRLTPRSLLGTVLEESRIQDVVSKVQIREVPSHRPKRTIRHRGYRDKGTLRPSHCWIETHDFSFREAQLLREEKNLIYDSTIELLIREVGDWVLKRYS